MTRGPHVGQCWHVLPLVVRRGWGSSRALVEAPGPLSEPELTPHKRRNLAQFHAIPRQPSAGPSAASGTWCDPAEGSYA